MVKKKKTKREKRYAAAFARLKDDLVGALLQEEYVPMNLRDYSCRVIQRVFPSHKDQP